MKTDRQPGTAYGYGRASTEEQETTLDAQEDAIIQEYEKRYKRDGYAWGEVYIDSGESGGTPFADREEGKKLNEILKAGDLVIIHKLDRGWRSISDFVLTIADWQKRGVRLALLDIALDTGTPMGEFVAIIIAAVAQFERRMTGERMKVFRATRKKQGMPHTGESPYGFRIVGPKGKRRYEPFPEQRTLGRRMLSWRNQTKPWSYEQIMRHLRDNGVVHPETGRPFSIMTVHRWCQWEQELQEREAKGEGKLPLPV